MALPTTTTIDYQIHEDDDDDEEEWGQKINNMVAMNKKVDDLPASPARSDSSDTPMLRSASSTSGGDYATSGSDLDSVLIAKIEARKHSILPSWLSSPPKCTSSSSSSSSSSWKVWATISILALLFGAIGIVVSSPKRRMKLDQYAANHGIWEFLDKPRSKSYCDRKDAFTNTDNDDGVTACEGTCYAEFRNMLVPSEGYSNGCNSCVCDPSSDGHFKCTMSQCNNVCQFNGWYYQPGEIVPHYLTGDTCNTCKCQKFYNETKELEWKDQQLRMMQQEQQQNGGNDTSSGLYTLYDMDEKFDYNDAFDYEIVCTEKQCKTTCEYEGAYYDVGDTFVGAGCPNSIWTCNSDGVVDYVGRSSNNNNNDNMEGGEGEENNHEDGDDADCEGYCTWENRVYEAFQCFYSVDGINKCSCMEDRNVICTDCANLK